MSKKEWLARCEMVYDLNFHKRLDIVFELADATHRYIGGQEHYFNITAEAQKSRASGKTLSQDTDAYNALQALSILSKSCQKCATNPDAWHMRGCMFGCEVNGSTARCLVCDAPAKRKAKNGNVMWVKTCKCESV